MQRKRSLLCALALILICALLLPAATTAGWQQPTSSTPFQPAGDGSWGLSMPLVFKSSCMPFDYNEALQQWQWNMLRISAPQAWPCSQGGAGVTIAIIDTGVYTSHPDLAGNLVPGASFVYGTTYADDHGHGTHVAGIAAGVANNGGILGAAPRARIMPIKVCDSGGYCQWTDVASGIRYAVDNGAQVVNLSLGDTSPSSIIKSALDDAYARGVVIVAAAGNTYTWTLFYPAAYTDTIAVAATDQYDARASFSTIGDFVAIAAPGVNIYSSYDTGGYAYMSGTSMAAPHVAGLAALIRAMRPSWTPAQIYAYIESNADDINPAGWDPYTGYGRINAQKAINSAASIAFSAEVEASKVERTEYPQVDPAEYRPGVVLFKLRAGASLAAITGDAAIQAAGLQVATVIEDLSVQELRVPAGAEKDWLARLRELPEVEYAELDGMMHIQ